MTQDEIIRMAREAGMEFVTTNSYSTRNKDVTHLYQNMYGIEKMEHFYNLAFEAGAAHEREKCAKVCEEGWKDGIGAKYQGDVFSAAIRSMK